MDDFTKESKKIGLHITSDIVPFVAHGVFYEYEGPRHKQLIYYTPGKVK